MNRLFAIVCSVALLLLLAPAFAAPASIPPASAPELARLGPHLVGVSETTWRTPQRSLRVMIWYPASSPGAATRYPGLLPALDGAAAIPFSTEALATRDAKPIEGRKPTLFFSHGFGSRPERHAWLAENLASKGYVVIAPDHADRAFTEAGALADALVWRATDIAGIASAALADATWSARIDRDKLGLIGYSLGGYGALRVAGAPFNPAGMPARFAPNAALTPLTEGGALDTGPLVPHLKALVLLAPWGGQRTMSAFTPASLSRLETPTLFLAGNRDDISGYDDGVASLFAAMTRADRTLVTFENGGHTFAADALPPEGRGVFAFEEFFEDPVWRKERLHAISQHFITAFLDLHVKGDNTRAPFLALPDGRSADGAWPQPPGARSTGAFAADQPGVTLWRGFQRRWAEGLAFRRQRATPP